MVNSHQQQDEERKKKKNQLPMQRSFLHSSNSKGDCFVVFLIIIICVYISVAKYFDSAIHTHIYLVDDQCSMCVSDIQYIPNVYIICVCCFFF